MRVDTITNEQKVKQLEMYLKANNYRDYIIFKTGTNLGLRVSDFLDIPKNEKKRLKDNGNLPYYSVGYFKDMCTRGKVCLTQQKTGKPVYFQMPEDIKELLISYTAGRDDNEPMFKSRFSDKALTRVGFFLAIKDAAEALSIQENVGCHTMRKIFGYFHYKKYHDIRLLMAIFNHGKEEITLKYIGIAQENIDNSMKKFSIGSFNNTELDAEKEEMLELKRIRLQSKKDEKQIMDK